MPRFSLIVPVYKVEEYLPKLCRVHPRAELSGLRAAARGRRLAGSLPRTLRRLRRAGSGAHPRDPSAQRRLGGRNRGIDEAEGDYIVLSTATTISPETLEELSRAIGQTGADLYHFGAFVERNGRVIGQVREQVPVDHVTDLRQAPRYFFWHDGAFGARPIAALFSDKSLRYPPQVRHEDIRLSVKLLARCERIVSLGEPITTICSARTAPCATAMQTATQSC